MTHEDELQIKTDLALIKQALLGNGVKGLVARVEEVEEYVRSHPPLCPMVKKSKQIFAIRSLEVAVIAVVVTILEIVLRAVKVL